MKTANLRRVTIIGLIAAISLIVAACGSSSKTTTTTTVKAAALPTSWELPGADAQNTREVVGIVAGDFGLTFADLIDEKSPACHVQLRYLT